MARHAWAAVPGDALAWLRRFFWTSRVFASLFDSMPIQREAPAEGPLPPQPALLPPLSEAEMVARIDAGDVFVNSRMTHREDLVSAAAVGPRASLAVLRALLRRGAHTWQQEGDNPTAFHIWAYYSLDSAGATLTTLLGAQPPPPSSLLLEAAGMAAEQCNAAQLAALLAVLNARGELPSEARYQIDKRFLGSSVVQCLESRGRDACHRCLQRDQPHAPSASVERTLAVLQAHACLDAATVRSTNEDNKVMGRLAAAWAAQARKNGGDARACALCFAKSAKLCQRCKAVRFCGDACMRAAWPLHRQQCSKGGGEGSRSGQ